MIYVHKDIIYTEPYYIYFCRILKSKNIKYKLIDAHDRDFVNSLDIKDDDVLIARFAHDEEDKIKTLKVFPTLTKKFKTMFPSKESYYYYDDKLRQYEFMLENDLPCLETHYVGSKEEIEKLNINFPIVTKKTWGAGAEQVNYFETLDSVVDDETTRSWTEESIYPCLIQEYQDVDYDYRLMMFDNKLHGYKRLHHWKTKNKNNFPYGTEENLREDVLKYRFSQFKKFEIIPDFTEKEIKDMLPLVYKLLNIQRKELNTRYMSWDVLKINGKYIVLEFSVVSQLAITKMYYDFNIKEFCRGRGLISNQKLKGCEEMLNQYIY